MTIKSHFLKKESKGESSDRILRNWNMSVPNYFLKNNINREIETNIDKGEEGQN